MFILMPTKTHSTNKGFRCIIEFALSHTKVYNIDPRRDIIKKSYYFEKRENEEFINRMKNTMKQISINC